MRVPDSCLVILGIMIDATLVIYRQVEDSQAVNCSITLRPWIMMVGWQIPLEE